MRPGDRAAAVRIERERAEIPFAGGVLVPICARSIDRYNLPGILARWRQRAFGMFLTQFPASPDRTRAWLQSLVVDDSRLLFLLMCDGRPVGHLGVMDLDRETPELDNLLRGAHGGGPEFVLRAEGALLEWLRTRIGVLRLRLGVFADNRRVIALHERCGFRARATWTAVRTQPSPLEVRYEIERRAPGTGERGYCIMRRVLQPHRLPAGRSCETCKSAKAAPYFSPAEEFCGKRSKRGARFYLFPHVRKEIDGRCLL